MPGVHRYVGKTRNPQERLRRHCKIQKRDRPTWRGKWLAKLLAENVRPIMILLVMVDAKHEDEAERELIRRLKAAGHPLTNGSDGGEGGRLHPEIQARATAKLKAMAASGELQPPTMTPEQKAARDARLSALRRDPRFNPMKRPEVVAKNRATNEARLVAAGRKRPRRNKRYSQEWWVCQHARLEKARAALPVDPCAAQRGRPKSEGHKAAIRATYAARSSLVLDGRALTLSQVAAAVGRTRKTIREFAKRHGLTLQEAVDRYAKLATEGGARPDTAA